MDDGDKVLEYEAACTAFETLLLAEDDASRLYNATSTSWPCIFVPPNQPSPFAELSPRHHHLEQILQAIPSEATTRELCAVCFRIVPFNLRWSSWSNVPSWKRD